MAPRASIKPRGKTAYNSKFKVAVQLISPRNPEVALPKQAQQAIAASVSTALDVLWLPQATSRPSKMNKKKGFAIETTILLSFIGTALAVFLAEFFKGVASEAGKDAYTAVKKLIAAILNAQVKRTYTLSSLFFLIFEFEQDYVAIPLYFFRKSKYNFPPRDAEAYVGKRLDRLREQDCKRLLLLLKKRKRTFANTPPGSYVHCVIWDRDTKQWNIESEESLKFFRNSD
jgi:hypothetical protein